MTSTDLDGTVPRQAPSAADFAEVQASPQFQELRTRLRNFVFPMTGLFLLWYVVYVLLGAYAHDFMGRPVLGHVNVGLLLGLGQIASTFAITGLYVRFAGRQLDPRAAAIRGYLEGDRA